ncbi:Plasmodium variant antigen protein Cir/Yir/Bir, putative [Plasmodium chabaudi adami]|uniref:Plasmodium variant antigen protein Cir/Yir/Bir, putative n=1 Tax=Plasmodium chabaudi adami TaxID=5826 RepID=A0A1D3LBI4_PLACE|nr:Plasmodium variant antigen protein Cir/Yir/Bir, putative [Plasmodium chabaudi adami]
MNEDMCQIFEFTWSYFPDTLSSDGNYQFKSEDINETYCNDNFGNCDTDLDKINAACFVLFEIFFSKSESLMKNAKNNINIGAYILAWLSHILSRKTNDGINSLNDFYNIYIKDKEKYNKLITDVHGYTSYQNIIDKYKELMAGDFNNMSKFYPPLKSLCDMHTECIKYKSDCTKCLEKANDFARKYSELNENSDNNQSDSYKNVLYSLSTDYNSFKKYCGKDPTCCNDTSWFPEIKAPQGSFQIFEATPSSSPIASILIPVLSIFVAIPIFLGVAYKYSLFGIDKRLQRQYLREKIKKIKKKMASYV